jgi:hypothetical protein
VTTIGLPVPVADLALPEEVQVAVNPVMVDPPVEVGAAKAIDAWLSPGVAEVIVGAPGAVAVGGEGA